MKLAESTWQPTQTTTNVASPRKYNFITSPLIKQGRCDSVGSPDDRGPSEVPRPSLRRSLRSVCRQSKWRSVRLPLRPVHCNGNCRRSSYVRPIQCGRTLDCLRQSLRRTKTNFDCDLFSESDRPLLWKIPYIP